MQNNYYLLRKISQEIAQKIAQGQWVETENIVQASQRFSQFSTEDNMRLLACFSQSKDELVMGFANSKAEFYIKAVLNADFSCLTFPAEFHRAKRNSVDLFKELIGLRVLGIKQFLNERSFCLIFENNYQFLFKMHGRRANAVLFRNYEFCIGFHKKMENDKQIYLPTFDRLIEQSYQNFTKNNYDWSILFPTFGKEINNYLIDTFSKNPILSHSPEKQWAFIQEMLQSFEKNTYYLIHLDTIPELSLLPPAEGVKFLVYSTAMQAYNEFYYAFTHKNTLHEEKNAILRQLQRRKKQIQSYIEKNIQKLAELGNSTENEENANLIMANLHLIKPHSTEVIVWDFYHNKERKIKLKKELSAQKNAENYYRKAKNQRIEVEILERNIANKTRELKETEKYLQQIQAIETIKELRNYLKIHQIKKEPQKENPLASLFKQFEYMGFEILVGKNAKNNDLLLQKYTHKEDLWLHAKDVAGSHVIVKHKAGQKFPKEVVEKAAQLAAYFSKRSQDSLCPVIVTPRKYVRKTKDLSEGQVIIEKEEVILVVPEPF
ncbi:MAG: NFACT RNA binding domain-containing protein [Microscillaceae bacterium]|nr:NFACT RNA binding domain-containing protein [Microscillaceae bacterium]MDW8459931.1 NFACT RNA binding domain-containing protein [Cytophagales bacterium]